MKKLLLFFITIFLFTNSSKADKLLTSSFINEEIKNYHYINWVDYFQFYNPKILKFIESNI